MGIQKAAAHPLLSSDQKRQSDVSAVFALSRRFSFGNSGLRNVDICCVSTIFPQKRYAGAHVLKKKGNSPRHRTADALNPFSISMVDCCCAYLLHIGRSAFHFVPRIRVILAAGPTKFSQLCDVLDTETAENHATNHTNDPLYIYATIGGLGIGGKRAEGNAAIRPQIWGRAGHVCVFCAPRPSTS